MSTAYGYRHAILTMVCRCRRTLCGLSVYLSSRKRRRTGVFFAFILPPTAMPLFWACRARCRTPCAGRSDIPQCRMEQAAKRDGAAGHRPFLGGEFLLKKSCFYYLHSVLSLGRVKYSLVSLRTTGESSATAIRLGIAIIPLKVSAMLHSRSSLTVAPRMATRE